LLKKRYPLHYSLRRFYIDRFFQQAVQLLPRRSLVLDLGGVKINKRGQFDISRYDFDVVCLNISTAKRPDIQADAASLPFKGGCFDAVVCAEVLEHVAAPVKLLEEAYRVLHADGILLMSAPFLTRSHGDPYDYGRYNEHFLLAQLSGLGFQDIALEKQGLFWSVVVEMLREYALFIVKRKKYVSFLFRRLFTRGINWGRNRAVACESRAGYAQHLFYGSFTTGFGITARK